MATAGGPKIVTDGLVFGYDTNYGVADNTTATRFYPGEPTTNFVTTNLETLGTDGSGQSSVGTRTTIAPNHVRIVDVASNTRQSHLISGLTASTIYTVSIQFKKITGTPTFRFQLQGYSGSSYVNTIKFTNTAETGLEDIEGWQTAEWTFTLPSNCNALRIWWQDGADYTTYTHSFELKNPQLEAKSHVTPYVSGTRSSTASLIDLKETMDIDVSNVSFDSTGQPTFDGSDDRITIPAGSYETIGTNNFTIEAVCKNTKTSSYNHFFSVKDQYHFAFKASNTGTGILYVYRSSSLSTTSTVSSYIPSRSEYYHIACKREGDNLEIFVNGVSKGTKSGWNNISIDNNSWPSYIGWGIGSEYTGGDIPTVKVYNKALTATEVKQNYNAYKNRFDI